MNTTPSIPPTPPDFIARPRPRRRRRQVVSSPPVPPAALVLVAAELDLGGPWVTLTFDRAIDVAGFVGSAIVVEDETAVTTFQGIVPATLIGPTAVRIDLSDFDPYSGAGSFLTASAGSGIVAVDDGGTWAGVTELVLPFP
ncbi:MAG TPA: hypothetical protein VGR35_05865 [Tepidisphaeraceae bacterium]|nr:hypothetical protein [Tepidisphaeraceae bacterium]